VLAPELLNESDPSSYLAFLPDAPVRMRVSATGADFVRVSWDNSPLVILCYRVECEIAARQLSIM
jgi:hypothetical protein